MFLRLASLTVVAGAASLAVMTTSAPVAAKDPTPYMVCSQHLQTICNTRFPGDPAAAEQCHADGLEARCGGMEGDPNNPPPSEGCWWAGQWFCPPYM